MSLGGRPRDGDSDVLVVSACLLGDACRYDGQGKASTPVLELVAERRLQGRPVRPVCPEELGGLGTPRPAAHLQGGDGHGILDGTATVRRVEDGADVTEAFLTGARRAAEVGAPIGRAILKARSPSCGCGSTWIDGEVTRGDGVFAALLRRQGVPIQTDEDLV